MKSSIQQEYQHIREGIHFGLKPAYMHTVRSSVGRGKFSGPYFFQRIGDPHAEGKLAIVAVGGTMIEKFTSQSESVGDARHMPAPESKTAVSKPLEVLLVEDSAGDGLIIHDVLKQSPTPVNVHLAR